MLAAMNRLVLVLLIAALPTQALAALVKPICQRDIAPPSAPAHHHAHAEGDRQHHDAPLPGHDHPLTMGDLSLDHCGSGCAFAPPITLTKLIFASGTEHSSFAVTRFSGHIPEQPQRPPRT